MLQRLGKGLVDAFLVLCESSGIVLLVPGVIFFLWLLGIL